MWSLNNILLNNNVWKEKNREIRKCFEINNDTIYQNLWGKREVII